MRAKKAFYKDAFGAGRTGTVEERCDQLSSVGRQGDELSKNLISIVHYRSRAR